MDAKGLLAGSGEHVFQDGNVGDRMPTEGSRHLARFHFSSARIKNYSSASVETPNRISTGDVPTSLGGDHAPRASILGSHAFSIWDMERDGFPTVPFTQNVSMESFTITSILSIEGSPCMAPSERCREHVRR